MNHESRSGVVLNENEDQGPFTCESCAGVPRRHGLSSLLTRHARPQNVSAPWPIGIPSFWSFDDLTEEPIGWQCGDTLLEYGKGVEPPGTPSCICSAAGLHMSALCWEYRSRQSSQHFVKHVERPALVGGYHLYGVSNANTRGKRSQCNP